MNLISTIAPNILNNNDQRPSNFTQDKTLSRDNNIFTKFLSESPQKAMELQDNVNIRFKNIIEELTSTIESLDFDPITNEIIENNEIYETIDNELIQSLLANSQNRSIFTEIKQYFNDNQDLSEYHKINKVDELFAQIKPIETQQNYNINQDYYRLDSKTLPFSDNNLEAELNEQISNEVTYTEMDQEEQSDISHSIDPQEEIMTGFNRRPKPRPIFTGKEEIPLTSDLFNNTEDSSIDFTYNIPINNEEDNRFKWQAQQSAALSEQNNEIEEQENEKNKFNEVTKHQANFPKENLLPTSTVENNKTPKTINNEHVTEQPIISDLSSNLVTKPHINSTTQNVLYADNNINIFEELENTPQAIEKNINEQLNMQEQIEINIENMNFNKSDKIENINSLSNKTMVNNHSSPSITEQIKLTVINNISNNSNNDSKNVTLQLQPVELGKVEIRFNYSDQQLASITIKAEKNESLELLQRDIKVLENNLNENGIKIADNNINFDLMSDPRQQNEGNKREFLEDYKMAITDNISTININEQNNNLIPQTILNDRINIIA